MSLWTCLVARSRIPGTDKLEHSGRRLLSSFSCTNTRRIEPPSCSPSSFAISENLENVGESSKKLLRDHAGIQRRFCGFVRRRDYLDAPTIIRAPRDLLSTTCLPRTTPKHARYINQLRSFSSKHEDMSLEGRYASALFELAKEQNVLEKVFNDLDQSRDALKESDDFRCFVMNPAFKVDQKEQVIQGIAQAYDYHPLTVNFLRVLIENKRFHELKKMVDTFESFYRAEMGQVVCRVSSAAELSSSDKSRVEASIRQRKPSAELIINYDVNPALMGGLLVKLGEQILDFSMSSRLERLQSHLLAPL